MKFLFALTMLSLGFVGCTARDNNTPAGSTSPTQASGASTASSSPSAASDVANGGTGTAGTSGTSTGTSGASAAGAMTAGSGTQNAAGSSAQNSAGSGTTNSAGSTTKNDASNTTANTHKASPSDPSAVQTDTEKQQASRRKVKANPEIKDDKSPQTNTTSGSKSGR